MSVTVPPVEATKNLWSYIKIKDRIMYLSFDGTTVTGAQEKAELINQQFISVLTH